MDCRKKYKIQGASPYPHIGNLIMKKVNAKNIPYSEVARRIGVTPSVFQTYLSQTSVQLGILWKIGIAIEYNFFADLMGHLPTHIMNNNDSSLQTTIKEHQNEIRDLKKEIDIYKGILGRTV